MISGITSPLVKLALLFMKIGILGFGGGYAILPLLFQTLKNSGLMENSDFANLIAVSQITPGPIAINAATWAGFTNGGFAGALVATLAFMLPPFILTMLAAHFLDIFSENIVVQSVLSGIRPVAIGLIAAAVLYIGESCLFTASFSIENIMDKGAGFFDPIPLGIFAVVIVLHGKFKLNPILLILAAGLLGIFVLS